MPGAPNAASLLLVVWPGAPSSVLVPPLFLFQNKTALPFVFPRPRLRRCPLARCLGFSLDPERRTRRGRYWEEQNQ